MNSELFLKNIKTNIYGKNIDVFETIESTNDYAIKCLDTEDVPEGKTYLALVQTNGKGSHGNNWISDKPLGLWLTIVVYNPYKQNPLSLTPAVALCKMLRNNYDIDAHLKWPNDILVGNKKIAGILCQVKTARNKEQACIIGVGLNIYQEKNDFDSNIKDIATSMKIIKNADYNLQDVYKNYMKCFEDVYTSGLNVVDEWCEYTKMIGKEIKAIKDKKEIIHAKVKDITKDGYLEVLVNGKIEIWISRSGLDIDVNY